RDHQQKGTGDVVERGDEGEGPETSLVIGGGFVCLGLAT
ncbi:hypothetical protein Tco_0613020, partial [Tanacetum coccineum]